MAERTLLIITGLFFIFFFCLAPGSGIPELYLGIAATFFVLRFLRLSGWSSAGERTSRAISFLIFTSAYFSFIFAPKAYAVFPELLIGWVFFLRRTIPRVATDATMLGITFVVTVSLVAGLTVFGRMFGKLRRRVPNTDAANDSSPLPFCWTLRWTFAVLFGALLMFLSGLAAFGILESGRSIWELRK